MSEFAQNAAAAAGWEASPTFDGKFDPNQQAAYVQQALNQGYDAIILASIDAKSIQAAIDAADAADVPVACIMCENAGVEEQVMDATTGGYNGGLALSTFVTVAVGGKGNIVGFDDKSFPIVAARMTGLQDGLKEYCPDCTYSQEDFPTTDLAKPGPPTWNGFLSANPPGKVQLVAGPYDFMSLPPPRRPSRPAATTRSSRASTPTRSSSRRSRPPTRRPPWPPSPRRSSTAPGRPWTTWLGRGGRRDVGHEQAAGRRGGQEQRVRVL